MNQEQVQYNHTMHKGLHHYIGEDLHMKDNHLLPTFNSLHFSPDDNWTIQLKCWQSFLKQDPTDKPLIKEPAHSNNTCIIGLIIAGGKKL